MKELWVEKYRPQKIEDYVFADEHQERQIKSWLEDGAIPHLLLSGTQGIGKTTLAKMLFIELGIVKADILELNASHDNSVSVMRDKITSFVSQMSFGGDLRYVLLDEADYLSPEAQAVLRGLMESSSSFARFVLTCNHPTRIIPALHSRCQGFHLTKLDKGQFDVRVATILVLENIEFDEDLLDTYVRAEYPDLRKCINSIQQNCHNGQLYSPTDNLSTGQSDYMIEMVELFKKGEINKARKLVCGRARPEEIQGIFTFLYQNLELWGNEEKQEEAILIIRDAVYKSSFVADQEINLAACLVSLGKIVKG